MSTTVCFALFKICSILVNYFFYLFSAKAIGSSRGPNNQNRLGSKGVVDLVDLVVEVEEVEVVL